MGEGESGGGEDEEGSPSSHSAGLSASSISNDQRPNSNNRSHLDWQGWQDRQWQRILGKDGPVYLDGKDDKDDPVYKVYKDGPVYNLKPSATDYNHKEKVHK